MSDTCMKPRSEDYVTQTIHLRRIFVRAQPRDGDDGSQAGQELEFSSPHVPVQQARRIGIRHQLKERIPLRERFDERRRRMRNSFTQKKNCAERQRLFLELQTILGERELALIV